MTFKISEQVRTGPAVYRSVFMAAGSSECLQFEQQCAAAPAALAQIQAEPLCSTDLSQTVETLSHVDRDFTFTKCCRSHTHPCVTIPLGWAIHRSEEWTHMMCI